MGEFLEKLKGESTLYSRRVARSKLTPLHDLLAAHSHSEVLYLQSQNGNIRSSDSEETEYAALRDDVPASFSFASDALGTSSFHFPVTISSSVRAGLDYFRFPGQEPDAVNLWIGGSHSQTSLHKDPYENLYAVLRGSKTFTVLPPTEGVLLGSESSLILEVPTKLKRVASPSSFLLPPPSLHHPQLNSTPTLLTTVPLPSPLSPSFPPSLKTQPLLPSLGRPSIPSTKKPTPPSTRTSLVRQRSASRKEMGSTFLSDGTIL